MEQEPTEPENKPSLDNLCVGELLIIKDGMIREIEILLLGKKYDEYKKASDIVQIIQQIIDYKLKDNNEDDFCDI